jgi:hypothetical protein
MTGNLSGNFEMQSLFFRTGAPDLRQSFIAQKQVAAKSFSLLLLIRLEIFAYGDRSLRDSQRIFCLVKGAKDQKPKACTPA